jgi:hypothetical protein
MTLEQAAGVVHFLLAGYPGHRARMSPGDVRGMVAFYAAAIADLDEDAVRAAITRLARTAEFIPTCAAIRAAVVVTRHGGRKTGAEAWGAVHRAMREEGWHSVPGVDFAFADAITARVVRSLGWADVCASKMLDHVRARFIEAYDEIALQERREAQVADGARSLSLEAGGSVRALPARRDRDGGPAKTIAELVSGAKVDDDAR